MNKIWIIGDIHGAYKALLQCIERSKFDKEKDTLIQLGDIADGWDQVYECIEELLTIKNLISIKGNHDQWFLEWINESRHPTLWTQGGYGTLVSYCKHLDKEYHQGMYSCITSLLPEDLPITHINFFKNQLHYYVDKKNNCFVHGGFDRNYLIEDIDYLDPSSLWWDRDLWNKALSHHNFDQPKLVTKNNFKEIFIGHTTTSTWDKSFKPMSAANVWNLDQGAGWEGKLTIMNLETKEYFQSDIVKKLYPNQKGR